MALEGFSYTESETKILLFPCALAKIGTEKAH